MTAADYLAWLWQGEDGGVTHAEAVGRLASLMTEAEQVRTAARDLLAYLRACNAADHVEAATNRSNAENLRHYMRALKVALGEDA
jgi:hypothetical protein